MTCAELVCDIDERPEIRVKKRTSTLAFAIPPLLAEVYMARGMVFVFPGMFPATISVARIRPWPAQRQ